ELALGTLGRDVHLARGHVIALGVELEVVDERFHRGLHRRAHRREDLVVRADRTGRQLVEALAPDLPALADLLDPNHEAVVAIAVGPDWDFEIHPVIDFVRLRFADVPRDAGRADHWPGKAP